MAQKPRLKLQPGMQVGEWTLLDWRPSRYEKKPDGGFRCLRECAWKCVCSCGVVRYVAAGNLATGQSKSCGCASLHASKNRHAVKNVKPINSVFALGGAA